MVWMINLLCLTMSGSTVALICGTLRQKIWLWGDICFLIGFIVFTYKRLARQKTVDDRNLQWLTSVNALTYCGLAYLAGVGAALLGIGGGLIKSPLLIAIGLRPISAVATSNYMVVFTASTNVLSYILAGRLSLVELLSFAPLSFVGGIIGVVVLRKHFAGTTVQSTLARILGWTIIVGGLAMLASGLYTRFGRHISDERTFGDACDDLHEKRPFFNVLLQHDL
ncbi:sulfite exporter TauE/SafE protein [Gregarina niphandrodes]|uniref:Sulfite exporter TauE/SafE protein n=1 Tax=Gregarina niphandrodes TaxID=110365 RepID=A0A023BBW2_GRENI|nr:sulfite exporter TauE/SafE protein [Gregarina niphandrodes]EZG81181.1 sulfite exporter TauE/SafE protein [Gregarina niphandrodes]|eukprot:XP_011134239.1 sulfite exporter TauE/SafE protein [Gregarina niphandrodes]